MCCACHFTATHRAVCCAAPLSSPLLFSPLLRPRPCGCTSISSALQNVRALNSAVNLKNSPISPLVDWWAVRAHQPLCAHSVCTSDSTCTRVMQLFRKYINTCASRCRYIRNVMDETPGQWGMGIHIKTRTTYGGYIRNVV